MLIWALLSNFHQVFFLPLFQNQSCGKASAYLRVFLACLVPASKETQISLDSQNTNFILFKQKLIPTNLAK